MTPEQGLALGHPTLAEAPAGLCHQKFILLQARGCALLGGCYLSCWGIDSVLLTKDIRKKPCPCHSLHDEEKRQGRAETPGCSRSERPALPLILSQILPRWKRAFPRTNQLFSNSRILQQGHKPVPLILVSIEMMCCQTSSILPIAVCSSCEGITWV